MTCKECGREYIRGFCACPGMPFQPERRRPDSLLSALLRATRRKGPEDTYPTESEGAE